MEIMNLQRADKLIPAREPGGLIEVQLANGGTLKSRSVILSTGARWRNVNVPGEDQYTLVTRRFDACRSATHCQ